MFLSFLLIWNWNNKYVHIRSLFPWKTYSIPDQNEQSVYPFSDQNGGKTLPFGAAHTYTAYIGEYPPPNPPTHPPLGCVNWLEQYFNPLYFFITLSTLSIDFTCFFWHWNSLLLKLHFTKTTNNIYYTLMTSTV